MKYQAWVVLIGVVVALAIRYTTLGKRPINVLLALVLGVGGAFGGHFAGMHFGLVKLGEPGGLIAAGAGAVVALAIYVALFRKS